MGGGGKQFDYSTLVTAKAALDFYLNYWEMLGPLPKKEDAEMHEKLIIQIKNASHEIELCLKTVRRES